MHPARITEWLLDLVFPKYCLGCKTEGAFLCTTCHERLRFDAPRCLSCSKRNFTGILCSSCQEKTLLRRFFSPFSYRNQLIRNLIYSYKYEGLRALKSLFADEVVAFLRFYDIRLPAHAVLVSIPLHRASEHRRGYNQSALLAEEISRRTGLPVVPALMRVRLDPSQIKMENYAARRKNVAGAFALRPNVSLRNRTVILVDDVATSGATLTETARVVRAAGAHTVWAITIAKR